METNKIDTIKGRIQDIARLAKDTGATEGERDAANTMLQKLLDKYALKIEDVLQEDAPLFQAFFTYTEDWENRLLVQIACCVTDRSVNAYRPRDKRKDKRKEKSLWIELTTVEELEIKHLYPQYVAAFREQFKLFYSAFIQANNLGTKPTGDEKPLTKEEKKRLLKLLGLAETLGSANVARSSLLLSEG